MPQYHNPLTDEPPAPWPQNTSHKTHGKWNQFIQVVDGNFWLQSSMRKQAQLCCSFFRKQQKTLCECVLYFCHAAVSCMGCMHSFFNRPSYFVGFWHFWGLETTFCQPTLSSVNKMFTVPRTKKKTILCLLANKFPDLPKMGISIANCSCPVCSFEYFCHSVIFSSVMLSCFWV